MNIQHILTLSIDAIALFYSALMAANFVLRLIEEWGNAAPTKSQGICAGILEPIFDTPDFICEEIADPWTLPVCQIAPSYPREFGGKGFPKRRAPKSLVPVQYNNHEKIVLLLPSAKAQNNLVQLNIRQLKKKASAAKVKNYNVMTKAQLIKALSA